MFNIFGFYKFLKIPYLKKNKKIINELLAKKNIRGTVIISKEGLNGTISGKGPDIKDTINKLKKILKFKNFNSTNNSKSAFQPFHKPKVKIKSEVVPMNLKLHKMIQKKDSLWEGECFVFDNRVSLNHGLKLGSYSICSGCRKPISLKNKNSEKYEEGVSCPNCHDKLTDQQKTRFRMRQKQINLAKKVGKRHIFQKEY